MKIRGFNTFKINESTLEFTDETEVEFIFQELMDEGFNINIEEVYLRTSNSLEKFDIVLNDISREKIDGYYPSYLVTSRINDDTIILHDNNIESLLDTRINYYNLIRIVIRKLSGFVYKVIDYSEGNEFKFYIVDNNYKNIKFDNNTGGADFFKAPRRSINIY